jgi:hypothetical protein
VLEKAESACRSVTTLTRDLSPLYAKVSSELFFNASPITDKFHIIRSLMEACQDIRIRFRQDMLRDKRMKYELFKKQEKEKKKECLSRGIEYQKGKFNQEDILLSNGETALEALAGSRYLLFKFPDDWTPSQRIRANALFDKFPEIKKVYDCACQFRDWMKKENVGKSILGLKKNYRLGLTGWIKMIWMKCSTSNR